MNAFTEALVSKEPNEALREELQLFGQFVGEWDFDWIWIGDGRREDAEVVRGEWIFSWVLDGTAIQDVWSAPCLAERGKGLYKSEEEIGTTLRFFDKKNGVWNVFYGCYGYVTNLLARKEQDKIVLEALHLENRRMRWVFTDITANSFLWQNISSDDDGKNWTLRGEMSVRRKNVK